MLLQKLNVLFPRFPVLILSLGHSPFAEVRNNALLNRKHTIQWSIVSALTARSAEFGLASDRLAAAKGSPSHSPPFPSPPCPPRLSYCPLHGRKRRRGHGGLTVTGPVGPSSSVSETARFTSLDGRKGPSANSKICAHARDLEPAALLPTWGLHQTQPAVCAQLYIKTY